MISPHSIKHLNDHIPPSVLSFLVKNISYHNLDWFWLYSQVCLNFFSSSSFHCEPCQMWKFCLSGSLWSSNSGLLLPCHNLATNLKVFKLDGYNCVEMKGEINTDDMPMECSTLYGWDYYFHFTDWKTQARKPRK